MVQVMEHLFTKFSCVEITQMDAALWDKVVGGGKPDLFCIRIRVVFSCR